MSPGGIIIVALLFAVALVALIADVRTQHVTVLAFTPLDRFIGAVLEFFGIGGLPPMLALFVLTSTAAITAAALEIIAVLYLGARYPVWFPADALASGLGIGLLCVRLTAPPAASSRPDGPYVSHM